MTNNPFKLKCLKAMGVEVLSRIPMLVAPNVHSLGYLQAKADRMSHLLHQLDDVEVQQYNMTKTDYRDLLVIMLSCHVMQNRGLNFYLRKVASRVARIYF